MEEESFTDSVCVEGGENNGGGKLHRQCVCVCVCGENNGGGKLHRQCVCVCVCGENNGGGKLHRQCVCGGGGGRIMEEESFTHSVCVGGGGIFSLFEVLSLNLQS